MHRKRFRISTLKTSNSLCFGNFLKDCSGYTGTEAIIVAVLLSMLVGAIFLPLVTGQFYWHRGESDTEVRRNARLAIDKVVRDIRQAGYKSTRFDFVTEAQAHSVGFEADLDGDGGAEAVRYYQDGVNLKKSVQKQGDPSATVSQVSDDVNSFNLVYFDAADTEITFEVDGSLSAANRLRAVLVKVILKTSITRADYTKDITLTSSARIRR